MKLEGHINNIPIYSSPDCPPDTFYLINDDFYIKYPKRKDGQPDMRYGINKLERMFKFKYDL